MKSSIAILLLAMLIASPAPASACELKDRLIPTLDKMHHNAPDITVREYRDPKSIETAMRFINDYPPKTYYTTTDAIVVVGSKKHGHGYVVAVDHGCILTNVPMSIKNLERFIDTFLMHPGTPA